MIDQSSSSVARTIQQQNTPPTIGFYRKPELLKLLGISDTTLWRMEQAGEFVKRKQITSRLVGWNRAEVDNWIASRVEVA